MYYFVLDLVVDRPEFVLFCSFSLELLAYWNRIPTNKIKINSKEINHQQLLLSSVGQQLSSFNTALASLL